MSHPSPSYLAISGGLVKLALPIWGAELAQMSIGIIGIIMTGHHSTTDLAAVSIGTSLWVPLLLLIAGSLSGLTSLVAHHYGAGTLTAIRSDVQQMGWAALAFSILIAILLWYLAKPILQLLHAPDDVVSASVSYIHALCFGLPALTLYQLMMAYSNGLNHTLPNLFFSVLAIAIDVPIGFVLIYGGEFTAASVGSWIPQWVESLPAYGALGAGIASAITFWCGLIGIAIYTAIGKTYHQVGLWRTLEWPRLRRIGYLLSVCLPLGVAIFAEVTMFTTVALLIASFGPQVIAAHEITSQTVTLVFITPLSLSIALTIQLGTLLGRREAHTAQRAVRNGLVFALGIAILNDLFLITYSRQILGWFSNDEQVLAMAQELLYFGMIFQISDVLQTAMAGALRGYKDTRIVMLFTVFAYWCIGMGSGIVLANGYFGPPLGVYGYWIGMIAGLTASAVMLGWRLHYTMHRPLPAAE